MIMEWMAYSMLLLPVAGLMLGAWLVSLLKNDVSIVDALWSILFLLIAVAYAWLTGASGPRVVLVLVLVTAWALRLSVYIAIRNHGQPEDPRYQEIRHNNDPGFRFKSAYIVFGLQGLLAWLIAMPLAAAMQGGAPLGLLDLAGAALWAIGMFFECLGDAQLARFKSDPASRGQVMDRGLWRYTRHPNYFGEFTLWWGFYLLAAAAGGWWTVLSPLLMTFLLLRVSGVSLLEKDIGNRRPGYAAYMRRTNAFFPGPPRAAH
jgi:steroid 5-alpha reductase family enzyme